VRQIAFSSEGKVHLHATLGELIKADLLSRKNTFPSVSINLDKITPKYGAKKKFQVSLPH